MEVNQSLMKDLYVVVGGCHDSLRKGVVGSSDAKRRNEREVVAAVGERVGRVVEREQGEVKQSCMKDLYVVVVRCHDSLPKGGVGSSDAKRRNEREVVAAVGERVVRVVEMQQVEVVEAG